MVTIPALQQMKRAGAEDRRSRGLGLSDRADRGSRRRGYRVRGRHGGDQFVGPPEPAGGHDGRDDRGLQGGSPRGQTRDGELRLPLRSAPGGHRRRAAGCHPAGGGGRGHGETGRRGRIPRGGSRHSPGGHPGVRAVRDHTSDWPAIRPSVQRHVEARGAAACGDDRTLVSKRPSAWKTPALRCSTSPSPGRWQVPQP